MKILLTGATGFIGSRLGAALRARGHHVVAVPRRGTPEGGVAIDFGAASASAWQPLLQDVDTVVNTVGIFRETSASRFERVHIEGPRALFEACVEAGVRRVVQLSALGADTQARSAYHRSKKAADDLLLALPLDAVIVQPSLVFGAGGASARVFLAWASLPLLPLPAGGKQALQPVHVDDAVQALVALVEDPPVHLRRTRVPLVGPEPLALALYLQDLRQALGLQPARTLAIPAAWMKFAAHIGDRLPHSLLDTSSWQMLQRGNVAAADAIASLLGHPPRPPRDFIAPEHADAHRNEARIAWLVPLLRLSIALVWIATGIVSLGVFPVDESFALLARAGVPAALQPTMLYAAAIFDLALGVLTLWPLRRRRWLWLTQAALIVFYSVVITLRLPEFWLHPYGPMLKNLPMLAVLLLLAMLEPPKEP